MSAVPAAGTSTRAPLHVYAFLAIGLVAASQSGNIARLGAAAPVVIAAWRTLLASLVLLGIGARKREALSSEPEPALDSGDGPVHTRSQLASIARLDRRELGLLGLAGAALALHFVAWITAVQNTTVANAAVIFAVNPILTAIAARVFFGEHLSRRLAVAIGVGLVGIGIMGSADFTLRPDLWYGDVAALVCSALYTVYLLAGKRVRRRLPTAAYTASCYGIASLCCFAAVLAMGEPVVDYDARTWLCFVLMAAIPTLLGHTAINHAVAYLRAAWLSATAVSEALMAGLGAYLFWSESITLQTGIGYACIVVSVSLLARDAR